MGGVGHLALQYAKAIGAEVIVLTRDGRERLPLARKLGADEVVDLP